MFKDSIFGNSGYPNMHEIIPKLYLGNVNASIDSELLKHHKINHVLSIIARNAHDVPVKSHLLLNLNDGEEYSYEQLEQGVIFLKKAIIHQEGVLVHCMAGISRSTSMICAYLMKERQLSPYEAVDLVKNIRNIADPALITFQSVIDWAYPTTEAYCALCNKIWFYLEDYNMFGSKRPSDVCDCERPEIKMRNKQ